MRRALISISLTAILLLASAPAAHPYTQQFTNSSLPIHWTTNTITVFLAASINAPPSNIKAGSDVNAAVRRALRRWSDAANINFDIRTGGADAVGAANDGANVISVSTANASFVSGGDAVGRTRVSFDPNTGAIAEADIALNPAQQFSTDATPGTYDLESTFVHEIGHFLGLDHSALIGATMQPRQVQNATNGSFTLTQTSVRTLSDDDLAGIRAIYGQRTARAVGAIQGNLNYPFAGAHVWAENAATGRVVGSAVTKSDGSYRIDQIPPGDYRVRAEFLDEPVNAREITAPRGPYSNIGTGPAFQTAATTATVTAGSTTTVVLVVLLVPPTVNARVQGLNGIVHAGPMPVVPGATFRYYVGGDGIDQIPTSGFSMDSPFFQIDQASFQSSACVGGCTESSFAAQLGFPVVGFDLRVLDSAKFGDYTLRMTRSSGESVYLAAGVVVDPYTDFVELNPIDNTDFFVRQQYRDFLFREPEPGQPWSGVLNGCPNQFNLDPASASVTCDRIHVSAAFFGSPEFQLKGFFVYRFYRVAFARQPTYEEIVPDMNFVTGSTTQEVNQKRDTFSNNFATRTEFTQAYNGMTNDTYVNTLMNRYNLQQVTTPDPVNPNGTQKVVLTRADLINRLNAGALTRAQVLRAIADSDEVGQAESNSAFVSMQYFGYLKRTAETQGFNDWLRTINANPADFRSMVNGFMNSQEYRSRFGHV
jgi:hypothetical protein